MNNTKIILEYWSSIPGYEGYYVISNKGNVASLDRYIVKSNGIVQFAKGQMLIPRFNPRLNVLEIKLNKNGKSECKKIHRLVAEAFVYNDDPLNKVTVNHIDGNRLNNCYTNLEWCTYSENLKHAYDVLNRTINIPTRHKVPCRSIDKYGNEEIYDSIAQASRKTFISETQIRRIMDGECKNENYEFYYL